MYLAGAYLFEQSDPAVRYMTRMYGLSAITMLFLVLSLGIIRVYFPRLRISSLLMHASRGFGLSVFLFAVLHALSAFTTNLDGNISAIQFLSSQHRLALLCSAIGFSILFLMAITSVDRIIELMSFRRWKLLHRFVHLASTLLVVHAFLIGSHFADRSSLLSKLLLFITFTFLFLEIGAVYIKTKSQSRGKESSSTRLVYASLILLVAGSMIGAIAVLGKPYDPHAGHTMSGPANYSRDYKISVTSTPETLEAGKPAQLKIRVSNANSGAEQLQFTLGHEKLMHLMIVSKDMREYHHLHPERNSGSEFTTSFTPAQATMYYVYSEFYPKDQIEALATASLQVTGSSTFSNNDTKLENPSQYSTGAYTVSMQNSTRVPVNTDVNLAMDITKTVDGTPVTNLKPYLGAYGHLAVISLDKQAYIHVHPLGNGANTTGKLNFHSYFQQPGIYKMYLQFQVDGVVHDAQFTLEVV